MKKKRSNAVLTSCAVCGHKISSFARRCPGCHVDAPHALAHLPPAESWEPETQFWKDDTKVAQASAPPLPARVISEERKANSQEVLTGTPSAEPSEPPNSPSLVPVHTEIAAAVPETQPPHILPPQHLQTTPTSIEPDPPIRLPRPLWQPFVGGSLLLGTVFSVVYIMTRPQPHEISVPTQADNLVIEQEKPPAPEPEVVHVKPPDAKAPLSGALAQAFQVSDDSSESWMIHQRRLQALVAVRETAKITTYLEKLTSIYPKQAEFILCELAEAFEAKGDYDSAEETYLKVLDLNPGPDSISKIMWFYATAPAPHQNLMRVRELWDPHEKALVPLASAARIEACFHEEDIECADVELVRMKNSDYSRIYAAKLALKAYAPQMQPRFVAESPHSVPGAYRDGIPTGNFTSDERIYLAEMVAIRAIRAQNFTEAEQLYRELLAHTENEDTQMTLQLALGKVLESQNETQALSYYNSLLKEHKNSPQVPLCAKLLNRVAWFLLKSKQQDSTRAMQLARQAVELTGEKDPSILDTLAEAYLQNGEDNSAMEALKIAASFNTKPYYTRRYLEELVRQNHE